MPSTATKTSPPAPGITPRLPHSGMTPPTSPIDSIHHALLGPDHDDPPYPSHPRKQPLADPPQLVLNSPSGGLKPKSKPNPNPKPKSAWKFSWGSPTSVVVKERARPVGSGHERTISKEESSQIGESKRAKNRSLSDRIEAVSGEMKRRLSGVGGVKVDDGDNHQRREKSGRLSEIKRIAEMRFRLATQRGNLPFVIVFLVCLVVFLSALAGIGYVPPSETIKTAVPTFKLGQPIYEGTEEMKGQQIMAARRKMEEAWAKQKRPADGAWMKKHRDDGAVRRKDKKEKAAVKATEEVKPAPIDQSIRDEAVVDEGQGGVY